MDSNKDNFVSKSGIIFGCIAKWHENGFITTVRGKNKMNVCSYVYSVDHDSLVVNTFGSKKATMNAPLLDNIFRKNLDVNYILHFHQQKINLPVEDWFPPGTVRDSSREGFSFNIRNHGCILSYNKEGNLVL
jgi:hypothetical protein